ncbi:MULTISPECIES: putative baseplate assembly protein [unclassified Streptomyces]|uniref:putative baseplate assembly protein n=1 Tax=unclassified Streptomyces TaxID=2593676 RepID=UPI002257D9A7|nr:MULTISPECIES: putative baseplate assembly protein [unclassified Streptomyces]WSP56382.1 putative baseplate assembly protein [Streptomyces sp. NBC_01241]WSU22901.1 putative baseplate assembly protein [Streptomyces sp. NBC_01108]MCX4788112.1 putative baseplate assembly protein [Streptomyces sp. NBC_01221]MCX4796127.1 putative baseplate assembly protein [Streptomyces sp. NBC_01242]WSP63783.1 putative baseplate assembly protein [Streptomyces sp. NBC_01240]
MTLPSPHLDDRHFQGLVDEAKRLVQQRCPEWTDHNVSDPGVTLIEAFATMVDQLVYRVNRVPEKSYLTFLDLIGVRLYPPTAARTDVTFRLSAPQPEPVRVRAGTEVATVRTETEEAVVFTTARELSVVPCEFAHLAVWPTSGDATDRTEELTLGRAVPCFDTTPTPGDALYLGLSAAVPSGVVVLRMDCAVEGVGVDPLRPPLIWEAWDGSAWTVCEVEKDDTGGFNRSGELILHLPEGHTPAVVVRRTGGWLRCRLVEAAPGRPTYMASPVVRRITAFTIGATVGAVHAETVTDEVLGAAEGVPGQTFTVSRPPVVPGEFVVEVADPAGGPQGTEWTRVDDFAHSGPDDRHITLDPNSGRVEFGPAVRERDGSVRHYGAVPPKGATVRVRSYRTGGGLRGNVARSTLRVLRSAIPYVARVENRRPALGGVDGETVDSARVRGPMTLRTLHRAVVPHDYELLAREVAPDASRVQCIPAGGDSDVEAGGVRLLVVPAGRSDEQGRIQFDELIPPQHTLALIAGHLDERRPIGARLVVEPPYYQGVTVVASVQARRGVVLERVREEALAALYGYFNPLSGGPGGEGWPFGRPIQSGEAFAVLQQVPGVDLVEDVRLFPADPVTGQRGEPTTKIALDRHALVFSYEHQLRVQEA